MNSLNYITIELYNTETLISDQTTSVSVWSLSPGSMFPRLYCPPNICQLWVKTILVFYLLKCCPVHRPRYKMLQLPVSLRLKMPIASCRNSFRLSRSWRCSKSSYYDDQEPLWHVLSTRTPCVLPYAKYKGENLLTKTTFSINTKWFLCKSL